MKKKTIIYTGITLTLIAIVGLFYRDYQCKKPIADNHIDTATFNSIRTMIEDNKNKISTMVDLEPFTPTQLASISSPFCASRHYFDNTTILNKTDIAETVEYFRSTGHEINLKKSPDQIWFCNDKTFGLLLKSSHGIGFFRDYYHEVVYDPQDRVKTESLDEKCYPTIMVKQLGNNWKYRIVSSQWD